LEARPAADDPHAEDVVKFFVTGAAGFIGSNLVDRLLAAGHDVVGFDNYSTGLERFLESARRHPRFRMVRGDLLNATAVGQAIAGCDFVFHLAANADVRFGTDDPRRDLDQNTVATFNLLEAMRAQGVQRIAFSSTGSIYGEASVFPTPEDAPFPVQTSFYGASKLGAEGFISAYCEGFGFQGIVFRFVSILGERYTHGHVFDFVRRLREDPKHLRVLGNGKQRKSYLYVGDCVDAMLLAADKAPPKFSIYNLGVDEYCEVLDSVGWICERLGVQPEIELTGGDRGWIGDNPFIYLDCAKARALGWAPKLSIRDGVVRTVDYLAANAWVLEARA
jgi:UDP-glucose 4-epimerase